MRRIRYLNCIWNSLELRTRIILTEFKRSKKYSLTPSWTKSRYSIMICFFMLVFFSGCSEKSEMNQVIPTVTVAPKSLLEQAVDWGNENLFESKKSYDSYILEEKEMNHTNYQFLLMNEGGSWKSELYYIVCKDDCVQKLVSCGGGNVKRFSYEVVMLSGNCYVAVYSATLMGDGGLELYPIDHPEGASYIINNVVDNHFERAILKDENGNEYYRSEIFAGGKLLPEYQDRNGDGFTDITFTGTKLVYEEQIGDTSNLTLTDTMRCGRTYYYNKETDSFNLGEESEVKIESEREKSYDYTGYLDLNSYFAENNPMKDYDGDGLEDRIYREYQEDTGKVIITLEFGNGTDLVLSNLSYLNSNKTESADLTGDGHNEILFEETISGSGGDYLYVSIFTLDGGSYVRMENPYREKDIYDTISGEMLCLPLVMKKLNETTISLYQPDCGYKGEISTHKYLDYDGAIFDDMEHLYSTELNDNSTNCYTSTIKLVEGSDNRTALLLKSPLGDRFVSFRYSVYWKLEYINEKWKITNVYQPTPKRIDLGEEYKADLNGDNQEEVICCDTKVEKQGDYELETPVLTLNGKEYNGAYFKKEFGISMTNCSHNGFYLLDIDVSDSYSEIAIVEEGLGSDPVSYFFRYDGEQLLYCGEVFDSPENKSFVVEGNGTIRAQKRLSILPHWLATSEWKYNQNGILQELIPDFYYTFWSKEVWNIQNIAEKDLILFRNPENNLDTIMIKEGERLYLNATDNEHWIQIGDYAGNQGWVYLHDGSEITLPEGEWKIGDILSYLNMEE